MKKEDGLLIYDINSCPVDCGLDMEYVMRLFREENVLMYDSKIGLKPIFIPVNDIHVNFVDLSKQENLKKLNGYKDKIK